MNTVPTPHGSPEDDEPVRMSFASLTPDGVVPISISDLPPAAREQLAQALSQDEDIPPAFREHVAAMLRSGVDAMSVSSSAETAGTDDDHAPGCDCAKTNRLWQILDTAFPSDPHLWNAMEALLLVSELSPKVLDTSERLGALSIAMRHLDARAEILSAQESAEALVGAEPQAVPAVDQPSVAEPLTAAQIDAMCNAFGEYLKRLP